MKKEIRPYFEVVHEHDESFKAFKNASSMLYNTVDTVIHLLNDLGSPADKKLAMTLQKITDEYRKAAYGD